MSRSSEECFESPHGVKGEKINFSRSKSVSEDLKDNMHKDISSKHQSSEKGGLWDRSMEKEVPKRSIQNSRQSPRQSSREKDDMRRPHNAPRDNFRVKEPAQRFHQAPPNHYREREDGRRSRQLIRSPRHRDYSPRDSRSPPRKYIRQSSSRRLRSPFPRRSPMKRFSPGRSHYTPRRIERSFSRTPPRKEFRRRRQSSSLSLRRPIPVRKFNGNRENPMPSKCIGIFGLSKTTVERDLYGIFDKFGRIDKIQLVMDKYTGQSQGFGFIYYENIDSAIHAKEEVAGTVIAGRPVRIDFSITKRAHTPTPGVYLGKKSNRDRFEDNRDFEKPRRQYSRSPYKKSRSGSYDQVYVRRDR